MRHPKATKNIRHTLHTVLEVCVRPNMPDNIISYVQYDKHYIGLCAT